MARWTLGANLANALLKEVGLITTVAGGLVPSKIASKFDLRAKATIS